MDFNEEDIKQDKQYFKKSFEISNNAWKNEFNKYKHNENFNKKNEIVKLKMKSLKGAEKGYLNEIIESKK